MSSGEQSPTQITPTIAGSKSTYVTTSALGTATITTPTTEGTTQSSNAPASTPTATARMLVPAILIPNPDGSTAVAQLVPSTQGGNQTIHNIIINSLLSKPNASSVGSSNNLLGVLTPVVNSSQGSVKGVKVIATTAPVGAKISITATAPSLNKATPTTSGAEIKFTPKVVENQPGQSTATISNSGLSQLLNQLKGIAPAQQFKKIQPMGGAEAVEAAAVKLKTYPKLIKGKKSVTEIKISKKQLSAATQIQVGDGKIVPIMNEFPNLITIHGLTKDKKDELPAAVVVAAPPETSPVAKADEASEGDAYNDLLCTEEMEKRLEDERERSSSKSPEPMEDDSVSDHLKIDGDNELESGNTSDSGVPDKRDEDERAKTFKPPTRIYKRPSILGTRKRIHPDRPEPTSQAILKETLRAELMKMNEEEEKPEAKKKKKIVKDKKGGAKIVTKIDESLIKPAIEDFDPANLLDWRDGVGVLPGSNLKFRVNELGLMELVEESEESGGESDMNTDELLKKCDNIPVINKIKSENVDGDGVPKKRARKEKVSSYDTCCCEQCGCYGLASEYIKQRFCSKGCEDRFKKRHAAALKKAEQEEIELMEKRQLQAEQTDVELKKLDTSKWAASIGSEEGTSEALPCPDSPDPEEESASMADADSTPAHSKPCSERNSPEPSSSTSPVSDQEEDSKNTDGYPNDMPWINFNTDKTPNFLWPKYLEFTKTRAAPAKLFEEGGFPDRANGFRTGMKLEGIDPRCPGQFVVFSVVSTKGFRVKMHVDGSSDLYDFWLNADSKDIFPAGYCEKIGRKLNPPKAFAKKFNWAHYVKETNSSSAPRNLFMHRQASKNTIGPSGFRIGMKLEAVDKSNHELVCVATVEDIMGGRILIHFDSWDHYYDYWADPSSPFIHPIGWCETAGVELIPPKGCKDFVWDDYLKETKAQAVPVRAFKPKSSPGFKKGMKLECVDPRFPQLIRVGSILEVKSHRLHIGFDNWPLETSTWMDADSPDIHPMGWCNKTGHPLGPPPVPGVEYQCYTPGCRALLKNSQFVLPHMGSCPLSSSNLSKARNARLKENKMKLGTADKEDKLFDKFEDFDDEENGLVEEEEEVEVYQPQVRRKKKVVVEPPVTRLVAGNARSDVHESVFRPGYSPSVKNLPVAKSTHARLVNWNNVEDKFDTSIENVKKWSPDVVSSFAEQVTGLKDKTKVFVQENINGNAFLMLSQSDLVELLGFKIGQAVKIYNSIILLKGSK